MTAITLWAIRRKSDGYYIPNPLGRNGRGGSFVEPVQPDALANIRLFHIERAAKIALKAWLQGHWVTSRGQSTDYFSGGTEYYEDTNIVPVEGRNADNMEVVEVTLQLPYFNEKPRWHLVDAVFIGDALWGDVVEKEHPHYHTPEEIAEGKHVKCSRILYRTDDNIFETANSIYIVDRWMPNAKATIPLHLDRKPPELDVTIQW